MECSICAVPLFILRNPIMGYKICEACYCGAKNLIVLVNSFNGDHPTDKSIDKIGGDDVVVPSPTSFPKQGFTNLIKWAKEMKEKEEELNEKLGFLGGFENAFKDRIHTDILVKPGTGGPPIPAHRAVLASKSEIFKNMLDSDGCKLAPSEAITIPELNYKQLEALLEFLYSGNLAQSKLEKHSYALLKAADKYEIPYLQKFCERQMLISLSSSNALETLEISEACSNVSSSLKETALNFIVKNMEEIVFSPRFEAFALKNPHLSVQITRASLTDVKNRRYANAR